jgi:hypothetical protein
MYWLWLLGQTVDLCIDSGSGGVSCDWHVAVCLQVY